MVCRLSGHRPAVKCTLFLSRFLAAGIFFAFLSSISVGNWYIIFAQGLAGRIVYVMQFGPDLGRQHLSSFGRI